MAKSTIIKYAFANALWTVFYVILMGIFLYSGPAIFGHDGSSALIPITLLLLFVFSATVCGSLILGRPILWYLDGHKKEALVLFAYTMAIFFVVTVLVLVVLYIVNNSAW